jgi:PAS domain-containing protein
MNWNLDWIGLIVALLGGGGIYAIILHFLNRRNTDKITDATVSKAEAERKQIEQDVESQYIKQLEQWLVDLNTIKSKHEEEIVKKDSEIVALHKQHLETLKELEEQSYQKGRIYNAIHKVLIGIDIPYWECDKNGNLIYANGAWLKLFGLTFAQATGDGWQNAIPIKDRKSLLLTWNSVVVDQTDININFTIQNNITGEMIKARSIYAVVHNKEGTTEKIIGVTTVI